MNQKERIEEIRKRWEVFAIDDRPHPWDTRLTLKKDVAWLLGFLEESLCWLEYEDERKNDEWK